MIISSTFTLQEANRWKAHREVRDNLHTTRIGLGMPRDPSFLLFLLLRTVSNSAHFRTAKRPKEQTPSILPFLTSGTFQICCPTLVSHLARTIVTYPCFSGWIFAVAYCCILPQFFAYPNSLRHAFWNDASLFVFSISSRKLFTSPAFYFLSTKKIQISRTIELLPATQFR